MDYLQLSVLPGFFKTPAFLCILLILRRVLLFALQPFLFLSITFSVQVHFIPGCDLYSV